MILLAGLEVVELSADARSGCDAKAWPKSWLIFSEAFADSLELGCNDMLAVWRTT